MASKKWSDLRPETRRKYVAAGVTPQRFNAWNKKTPAQKREATRKAKAAGFSGTGREAFLKLRPHQISGSDPISVARAAMFAAFGDRPLYSPRGVTRYLLEVREEHGVERLKEIASLSPAQMDLDNRPFDRETSHYYH